MNPTPRNVTNIVAGTDTTSFYTHVIFSTHLAKSSSHFVGANDFYDEIKGVYREEVDEDEGKNGSAAPCPPVVLVDWTEIEGEDADCHCSSKGGSDHAHQIES